MVQTAPFDTSRKNPPATQLFTGGFSIEHLNNYTLCKNALLINLVVDVLIPPDP